MNDQEIEFSILPTPNPNALKFVLDRIIKAEGKSTYRKFSECENNPMAQALFDIRGIDNLHFFQNTITVTKFSYEDWDALEPKILACLRAHLDSHDPNYKDPDPEAERRSALSPELQKIEDILDRTIRPGLQADGGDLTCLSFENNVLLIRYHGACGTCPSSTSGTLNAIRGILSEEMGTVVDVYIAPDY